MALAPLLLSSRGLTGWVDPTKIISGDLAVARNLDFSYGHMVQKEGGTLRINSTALSGSPVFMCGFDWWPTATVQRRVVATSDGVLYKDDMTGTFGTTLATGLGTNKITQMVEGGAESQGRSKKLFICNGNSPVQVLIADGVTTGNISVNAPADWVGTTQPTFLFRFRTALCGGGNSNDPHRVYISAGTDHEDFRTASGGLSLSVFPGDSQSLVAGLSGLGKAYLWKYPAGIYYIVDDDNTSSNWYIRRITGQYGGANTPHCVAQIDQSTIAFIDASADLILMQESSGSLTGVEFTDLTKTLNLRTFIKNEFNLGHLSHSQLRWYPDKKQLHVLMTALGSSDNNRRIIIDFGSESPRIHISDKDSAHAIWMELDSDRIARPIIGDNIGFARKIDQNARSLEGSTPYTMTLSTVASDFSDIDAAFAVKKLFYRLHMEYETTGAYDVNVEIIVDGKSLGVVSFNQGSAGSLLPFVLPGVLGGADMRRRSRAIAGEGYYFAVRVLEATTNNPRIARLWVEFDPLDMAL